jgi:phosphopantothenoylcysteine decarboxylase/phosphopantothenate--cysteine ligase
MYAAAVEAFPSHDIAIMAAAVADYTPDNPAVQKIKKKDGRMELVLSPTKDILKTLGGMKRTGQVLVGFALETENEKANALEKLQRKNADFIILNSMNDVGAGFGSDTNKITIFDKEGREWGFEMASKQKVAADILNTIMPS